MLQHHPKSYLLHPPLFIPASCGRFDAASDAFCREVLHRAAIDRPALPTAPGRFRGTILAGRGTTAGSSVSPVASYCGEWPAAGGSGILWKTPYYPGHCAKLHSFLRHASGDSFPLPPLLLAIVTMLSLASTLIQLSWHFAPGSCVRAG